MSDGGGLQKKFKQKAAKEAKTSKWARASLLSKKSSKKGLTRRPLFLVRVESLVCTVEMIGPSRSAGAGRDALQDALPRVPTSCKASANQIVEASALSKAPVLVAGASLAAPVGVASAPLPWPIPLDQ